MTSQQRSLSTDADVDGVDDSTDLNTRRPSWASPQNEDGEGRTYSRRRSLECTSVEVQILGTEQIDDHILYIIEVSSGIKKWTVYRRFRDFYFLDKQLRKCFPKIKIPPLPAKRFFGSSTDKEFVESRKEQLESYLTTIVGIQSIWTRNELALFLNNDANAMMFIWNFERMRRMQDMLSSMSIENQTETAKLNSDLTVARDQVVALQDRLSRMEMLFLQQATGVASQKLSSSALRSLSGIDNSLSHQLASELTEEHSELYAAPRVVAAAAASNSATSRSSSTSGHAPSRPHLPSAGNDEDFLRQNIMEDAIQAHVSSGETMSADEVVRVLSMARDDSSCDLSQLSGAEWKKRAPEEVKAAAVSIQLAEALRISNEIFEEQFDIGAVPAAASKLSSAKASEADLSRLLTPRTPQAVAESRAERELYAGSAAWAPLLLSHVDDLLRVLSPSAESLASRHRVFQYVRSVVSSTLGVQLFPVGSFVSHTFLPDGDVDTTAFVLKNDDDSWFVRVNEALCMSAFHQAPLSGGALSSKNSSFDTNPETTELLERGAASNPPVSISNVSFVNAEIKMIKSMIDSVCVDISVNQVSALYAQAFIERLDQFVGCDHLFKRAVLLVKAWCQYESPRHTHGSGSLAGSRDGRDGRISSWAMVVMLTWVFNSEGRGIAHPLQALGHFLRIFSNFDWDRHAITVAGPVSASDLSELPDVATPDLFFPAELMESVGKRSDETRKMACFPSQQQMVSRENSSGASSALVGSASADEAHAKDSGAGVSLASASEDNVPAAPPVTPVSISKPPVLVNTWVTRSAFPESECVYQQGLLNVMDPVAPTGNCCLTRNLDAQGFDAIVSALREGYKHFQGTCDAFAKLHGKASAPSASHSEEVSAAAQLLLLNTSARATALTQSVSRNLAKRAVAATAAADDSAATVVVVDVLQAQTDELEFSLRYAELVLGGRVSQDLLVQLIEQILQRKGAMPVGEVGKNLQAITGCDGLSRRLKEQFSGLKKAIELSGSPRLKVGTEHPFNPIVALVDAPRTIESGVEGLSLKDPAAAAASSLPPFGHLSFVFVPLLAMAALTSSNIKEAAAQHAKSAGSVAGSRSTYRRAAPYYLEAGRGGHGGGGGSFDTMSVMTQSTRGTAAAGGDSNYIFNKKGHGSAYQGGRGGHKGGAPQSPGRYSQQQGGGGYRGGYAGNQAGVAGGFQGGGVGAMMYAQTVDGVGGYVPVQHQHQQQLAGSLGSYGSPLSPQPMGLYQQQQQQMHMAYLQQQQMYQNYAASCMAASSGTSLGSSYGHSMSPGGGASYMQVAEQQNLVLQQQLAQQQFLQQQAMQAQGQQQQQQPPQQLQPAASSPKNGGGGN